MADPGSRQKVKAKLRRRLGLTDAKFQALWNGLDEDQWIASVLDPQENETEDDLLEEARRRHAAHVSYARLDKRRGRKKSSPTDDEGLTHTDTARAAAIATYLAHLADLDWDVKRVRRRLCGTKLLSSDEANALLTSQAARVMTLEDFSKLEIPLLAHEATIEVRPCTWKGAGPETNGLRIHFRAGRRRFSIRYSRHRIYDPVSEPVELALPVRVLSSHACGWLPVWRDSILDEVRVTSDALVHRFRFLPDEATWYLLTGEVPAFHPLWMTRDDWAGDQRVGPNPKDRLGKRTFHQTRLKLTVSPWLSDDTLVAAYRRLRRRTLGRDNRPIHPRSIAVLKFVADAMRKAGGRLPPWGELLKSWNRSLVDQPTWRFRRPSDLKTVFEDAVQSVVLQERVRRGGSKS